MIFLLILDNVSMKVILNVRECEKRYVQLQWLVFQKDLFKIFFTPVYYWTGSNKINDHALLVDNKRHLRIYNEKQNPGISWPLKDLK